jgi:hypothetical protein
MTGETELGSEPVVINPTSGASLEFGCFGPTNLPLASILLAIREEILSARASVRESDGYKHSFFLCSPYLNSRIKILFIETKGSFPEYYVFYS